MTNKIINLQIRCQCSFNILLCLQTRRKQAIYVNQDQIMTFYDHSLIQFKEDQTLFKLELEEIPILIIMPL